MFVLVFPHHLMEKSKRTFWPTQYQRIQFRKLKLHSWSPLPTPEILSPKSTMELTQPHQEDKKWQNCHGNSFIQEHTRIVMQESKSCPMATGSQSKRPDAGTVSN